MLLHTVSEPSSNVGGGTAAAVLLIFQVVSLKNFVRRKFLAAWLAFVPRSGAWGKFNGTTQNLVCV